MKSQNASSYTPREKKKPAISTQARFATSGSLRSKNSGASLISTQSNVSGRSARVGNAHIGALQGDRRRPSLSSKDSKASLSSQESSRRHVGSSSPRPRRNAPNSTGRQKEPDRDTVSSLAVQGGHGRRTPRPQQDSLSTKSSFGPAKQSSLRNVQNASSPEVQKAIRTPSFLEPTRASAAKGSWTPTPSIQSSMLYNNPGAMAKTTPSRSATSFPTKSQRSNLPRPATKHKMPLVPRNTKEKLSSFRQKVKNLIIPQKTVPDANARNIAAAAPLVDKSNAHKEINPKDVAQKKLAENQRFIRSSFQYVDRLNLFAGGVSDQFMKNLLVAKSLKITASIDEAYKVGDATTDAFKKHLLAQRATELARIAELEAEEELKVAEEEERLKLQAVDDMVILARASEAGRALKKFEDQQRVGSRAAGFVAVPESIEDSDEERYFELRGKRSKRAAKKRVGIDAANAVRLQKAKERASKNGGQGPPESGQAASSQDSPQQALSGWNSSGSFNQRERAAGPSRGGPARGQAPANMSSSHSQALGPAAVRSARAQPAPLQSGQASSAPRASFPAKSLPASTQSRNGRAVQQPSVPNHHRIGQRYQEARANTPRLEESQSSFIDPIDPKPFMYRGERFIMFPGINGGPPTYQREDNSQARGPPNAATGPSRQRNHAKPPNEAAVRHHQAHPPRQRPE